MISKLKEAVTGARLRAGQMWRERKERIEERKQATEPPGVTIPLSLVRSAKLASWMAYFCLVYFLWLYTLDIARDRAGELHLTHVGSWIGELSFYFPYIIGFALVAVGIPYVAKIALPTFMSLSWHDNAWAKSWALFIVLCVSSVIIAGTFTVQGDTIMERDRESAVAVEQVQQGRAALEAQIESRRQELADMMNNSNAYLAQAASVGAAEWQRSYIDQTPANDPQRDRIVRALGAARSADTLRAELSALRQQLATSTTTASVQGEVVTERTGWIADALGWLEGVRAILLSLVMDIVCLVMPWIALRLEQARNRQLGLAEGIAPHPWMLEKPRENEAPVIRPEDFAKRRAQDVVDAMIAGGADPRWAADMARSAARSNVVDELAFDEDGAPLTRVEYWKRQDGKPLMKRQKNRVIVPPGPPLPDETGVDHDGGARIASVAASAPSVEAIGEVAERVFNPEPEAPPNGAIPSEPPIHPEPSTDPAPLETLSEEELDVLLALESAAATGEQAPQEPDHKREPEPVDNPDLGSEMEAGTVSAGPIEDQDEPRTEPETDERRMLAANVAAE